MSMVRGVVGSLVGGAIGAGVWTAVSYTTEYEIGWIAWGIGALAGLGMSIGNQGPGGAPAGVIAAVIALVSVFGGKYAAVHFTVEKSFDEAVSQPVDVNALRVRLADEVVREWEAEGRALKWPKGMTLEEAQQEQDYPAGVWDLASSRLDELTPAEREQMLQEMTEQRSAMLEGIRVDLASTGFQESLGGYDFLWAGLAVVTAFRLASRDKEAAAGAPAA